MHNYILAFKKTSDSKVEYQSYEYKTSAECAATGFFKEYPAGEVGIYSLVSLGKAQVVPSFTQVGEDENA